MQAKADSGTERRAESLLVAMAWGIVAVIALVGALALVGEWRLLAATMATLLTCAGGVVAMILALLAQTGDALPPRPPAKRHSAVRPADGARPRGRWAAAAPALGGAPIPSTLTTTAGGM